MRDSHLSSDLVAIDDAGFSVVAASRAYAPASQGSSLANELRLYTVQPNVLVIGPVAPVEAMLSTITAMSARPSVTGLQRCRCQPWAPSAPW